MTVRDFADELELHDGVSGYSLHTVPVVIQCWLRQPRDLRAAVLEVIDDLTTQKGLRALAPEDRVPILRGLS